MPWGSTSRVRPRALEAGRADRVAARASARRRARARRLRSALPLPSQDRDAAGHRSGARRAACAPPGIRRLGQIAKLSEPQLSLLAGRAGAALARHAAGIDASRIRRTAMPPARIDERRADAAERRRRDDPCRASQRRSSASAASCARAACSRARSRSACAFPTAGSTRGRAAGRAVRAGRSRSSPARWISCRRLWPGDRLVRAVGVSCAGLSAAPARRRSSRRSRASRRHFARDHHFGRLDDCRPRRRRASTCSSSIGVARDHGGQRLVADRAAGPAPSSPSTRTSSTNPCSRLRPLSATMSPAGGVRCRVEEAPAPVWRASSRSISASDTR